jgi:hypothetical protein
MEPQRCSVIHCNWRMVGFCRVEYTEYVLYPHLFSLPSHISHLCLRRFDIGEKIYKCTCGTTRCSRKFNQDRLEIRLHCGRLHCLTYRRWPRQRHWHSRGRRSAPPDHAGWAFATPPQEFNWYVEISLSTGDTHPFFFCTWDADILLVCSLDGISHGCRDTACGLSHFRCLMTFS